MDRETYLSLLRDITSGDPRRVREANRRLYSALVDSAHPAIPVQNREADLVLAEVPQTPTS
jgi:hypothetical protein